MIKKATIATGVFAVATLAAASMAFAQTPTTTANSTANSTANTTTNSTVPSSPPATGHGA